MKQQPSRLKYKKNHKVMKSFFSISEKKSFLPIYGRFALKSIESGKLTLNQIEAGRKSLRRNICKKGLVWIRVFTSKSITKKPLAVRMGKGKGNHALWICPIRSGQIIFELSCVSFVEAQKAFRRASLKIPLKTKFVKLFF